MLGLLLCSPPLGGVCVCIRGESFIFQNHLHYKYSTGIPKASSQFNILSFSPLIVLLTVSSSLLLSKIIDIRLCVCLWKKLVRRQWANSFAPIISHTNPPQCCGPNKEKKIKNNNRETGNNRKRKAKEPAMNMDQDEKRSLLY